MRTEACSWRRTRTTMSQRPSRHPNFGRNQKFTPETCERIVRCIGNGNFRCTAATMAGVSQQSMSTWMNSDDRRYADFQRAVLQAEAEVEARAVGHIVDAGFNVDPKWLTWWLERKFRRWNSAVHRWELQVVQKQLKELRNVVAELAGDAPGGGVAEGPCAVAAHPPQSVGPDGADGVCPKQGNLPHG